jgi:hypothetical protein
MKFSVLGELVVVQLMLDVTFSEVYLAMDKIVTGLMDYIIGNTEIFPEFGVKIVIYLFLILAVTILVKNIAKSLQDPELIKATLFISKKTRNVSKAVIKGASEAVESPIKRPRVKFVATVLSAINGYMMSLLFLCFSLLIVYLMYVSNSDIIWYKQIGTILFLALLFWLSLFFRAQADKDYVSVKAQWRDRDKFKM